jgi:hypothetical protein
MAQYRWLASKGGRGTKYIKFYLRRIPDLFYRYFVSGLARLVHLFLLCRFALLSGLLSAPCCLEQESRDQLLAPLTFPIVPHQRKIVLGTGIIDDHYHHSTTEVKGPLA